MIKDYSTRKYILNKQPIDSLKFVFWFNLRLYRRSTIHGWQNMIPSLIASGPLVRLFKFDV